MLHSDQQRERATSPRLPWWIGLGIAMGLLSLPGCLKIYQPEIPQGNVLTPERVDQLQVGLSQAQVRQILGHSLVVSTGDTPRWLYVDRQRIDGKLVVDRSLELVFDDQGRLQEWIPLGFGP